MNTPPQSIASILEDAAKLIEPEGAWIKGVSARTAPDGKRTLPAQADAKCWCASGAICRAALNWRMQDAAHKHVVRLLRRKIWTWNDDPSRTQAEVVAKLREAAALAREQGK